MMKPVVDDPKSVAMKSAADNATPSQRRPSIFRKPALRNSLLAVALGAIAAVAYFFYANRPITVPIGTIEHEVPVRVFGLGTVEARVRSSVGFEVGARLVELNADHGDRVNKGDVLARLNLGEQQARVAKATAAVIIAEAGIKKAEANLRKMRAVAQQKQDANRRKQALVSRSMVSAEVAEDAQREENVAKAEVSVAIAETEVANALLTDARAQLQFEQTLLGHRTLLAPYDSIVIERHKELGTVVKPGDPIFTLIALGTYWGLAYVDEARAGHLREGQKVDARLRSRPQDAFTGTVARISLESDRVTEERRVFIAGDNPPAQVYLGEQAEFWITVAQLKQALLVPEAAVQGFDGVHGSVWTLEFGRLQQRTVTFRHHTEDARLEIVDGLPAEAKVVTRLGNGLRLGRSARAAQAVQQ